VFFAFLQRCLSAVRPIRDSNSKQQAPNKAAGFPIEVFAGNDK